MSSATARDGNTVPGLWRLLVPALLCWGTAAALIHSPGSGRLFAALAGVIGAGLGCVWGWRVWAGTKGNAGRLCRATGSLTRSALPEESGQTDAAARHVSVREQQGLLGFLLVCSAAVLVLGVRIDLAESARATPLLATSAEAHHTVAIDARLTGYPAPTAGHWGATRGWVRAQITGLEGNHLGVHVPVILWLPDVPPPNFHPGTVISAKGSLQPGPPEGLAAYEVRVQAYTRSGPSSGVSGVVGRAAASLRARLHDAASRREDAALVPGLAVGDTSLVGEELDRVMLESSLTHLTAVSGSNCALVVTALRAGAAWIGCGRRIRIVVAAAGLGCFVIVVGPDASVQRAAVMAAVMLASGFGGRRRYALPALGLAMLGLLVADPWQAIQPGFALSVTATAGILLWATPLESWLRTRARLPQLLALPLAVAVVAQVVCAPLLLLLQPGLPIGGVLANLLAAPAAPAGTILGMLALLALPMSVTMGDVLLAFAVWPARWIEAAGAVGAELPGGRWYWPGGWAGALVLTAVYALAGVAWLMVSGWAGNRPPFRVLWSNSRLGIPRRAALFAGGASGIAAGVVFGLVVVVPVAVQIGVPRDWAVAACDVGQGDALLLRNPAAPDTVMLVDTGGYPELLTACLDLFGVRDIDLLVVTHHHEDHMGALSVALPRSRHVLVGPYSVEEADGPSLAELIAAKGGTVTVGEQGMRGGSGGEVLWEVLGPEPKDQYEGANAASLVLLVHIGQLRVLLLGDSGEPEHRALLRTYPGIQADVVKVAHHGSKDQAIELYEALGAEVGVISSGADNSYGHPNPGLVDALGRIGTRPLRTDELGSIGLLLRETGVELWAAGERSALLHRERRRLSVSPSR